MVKLHGEEVWEGIVMIVRATVVSVLALLLAWPAGSECLSGIAISTGATGSLLYDVHSATGTTSKQRGTGQNPLGALTEAPDGRLLTLRHKLDTELYEIDPATGTLTLIGATGLSIGEGGLAFHPTTGVLYGVNGRAIVGGGIRGLFTLDPTTGVGTLIGPILSSSSTALDVSALAFDPGGTLYAISTVGTPELLELDPSDATVISRMPLAGLTTFSRSGMAFEPLTGTLYAILKGDLVTIDPGTGVFTTIGPTLVDAGLAFVQCAKIVQSDVIPDFGRVPGGGSGPAYDFQMGQYEVTNSQFVSFLNDAELDGGATLRGSNMVFAPTGRVETSNGRWLFRPKGDGGITHDSRILYNLAGALGSRYSVEAGYGDYPVTTVSWLGAMKYSNWLTIAWGFDATQAVYTEGAETEDWHPKVISTGDWIQRKLNNAERQQLVDDYAGFRLPMDNLSDPAPNWVGNQENPYNEWYKAAAYDPAAPPTSRLVIPVPAQPGNNYTVSPFHWVYGFGADTITGADANFNTSGDPIEVPTLQDDTPVGFYDGTLYNPGGGGPIGTGIEFQSNPNRNPYDVYDLAGNIVEWIQDHAQPAGTCEFFPLASCFTAADCAGFGGGLCEFSGVAPAVLRGGNFANSASTYNEIVNAYSGSVGGSNVGGGIGFRIMTTASTRLFCIEGTSNGTDYSWSISGANPSTELNAPGTVLGTDATGLAAAFVASLNGASIPAVTAAASPVSPGCFQVSGAGTFVLSVGEAGQAPSCVVTSGGCIYNPFIWEESGPPLIPVSPLDAATVGALSREGLVLLVFGLIAMSAIPAVWRHRRRRLA